MQRQLPTASVPPRRSGDEFYVDCIRFTCKWRQLSWRVMSSLRFAFVCVCVCVWYLLRGCACVGALDGQHLTQFENLPLLAQV